MIWNRMYELMAERNMSIQDLSDSSGIPLETLRNIYYKKVKDPKVSTIFRLAQTFGVSMDNLLGDEKYVKYDADEVEVIRNYRSCGHHGKSIIKLVSRFESTAAKKEREGESKHRIPCLIPVGKVEDGIYYNTCNVVDEYTNIEAAYLSIEITSNYFAPAYCMGDHILIENRFPEEGERAVFTDGIKAYFRLFERDGDKYILKCLNGRGKDIFLNRMDEMDCIGTCISVVRK